MPDAVGGWVGDPEPPTVPEIPDPEPPVPEMPDPEPPIPEVPEVPDVPDAGHGDPSAAAPEPYATLAATPDPPEGDEIGVEPH